jgi:hypothetical protein
VPASSWEAVTAPGPRAHFVAGIKRALASLVDDCGIVPIVILDDDQGLRDNSSTSSTASPAICWGRRSRSCAGRGTPEAWEIAPAGVVRPRVAWPWVGGVWRCSGRGFAREAERCGWRAGTGSRQKVR